MVERISRSGAPHTSLSQWSKPESYGEQQVVQATGSLGTGWSQYPVEFGVNAVFQSKTGPKTSEIDREMSV